MFRSRRTWGLGVGLLLCLASCGGEGDSSPPIQGTLKPTDPAGWWPKFRKNPEQTALSEVRPSKTGGARWEVVTGKGIFSSPIVGSDGTIYVGSADRTFYAIARDGTVKWSELTGEIIDSSGMLDDKGRVFFGSGDGKLRAREAATGKPIWEMQADDPSVNNAFINWFEGNVAHAADGTLYVPNDNFFVYAVNPDTGEVKWRFKMADQTWSLPAVDVSTGSLYIGNNNLLPVAPNTYAIDSNGEEIWSTQSLGTVAASPLITPDGAMIVGGFDGYVRAYRMTDGEQLWELGTRDHVYASAAMMPDGSVVQPSADGTIYDIDAKTGAIKWAFDTSEPIRSSPAVDADGNVYVGSGEGRLFVLNPDGTLRWAIRLIDDDRNDLNASPALGPDAIYIAGENGHIFSVPYDWCLRDDVGDDKDRCTKGGGEALPESGALLLTTSPFGSTTSTPPRELQANAPLVLTLAVREKGDSKLAILDASSISVTSDPPVDVVVDVAGDGKFVTITPKTTWLPSDADGQQKLTIKASYLVDMQRTGLKLSGGTKGGDVSLSFSAPVRIDSAWAYRPQAPTQSGDPSSVWEISRRHCRCRRFCRATTRSVLTRSTTSQSIVEGSGPDGDQTGIAWMIGAKLAEGENKTVVDPATKLLVPLTSRIRAQYATLENQDGLKVEVMNATIPFRTFGSRARSDRWERPRGSGAHGARSARAFRCTARSCSDSGCVTHKPMCLPCTAAPCSSRMAKAPRPGPLASET
ncbi:MAG: PQQ-binding-like beta-propeller repeat protein [Polyangiaceae bacterium]